VCCGLLVSCFFFFFFFFFFLGCEVWFWGFGCTGDFSASFCVIKRAQGFFFASLTFGIVPFNPFPFITSSRTPTTSLSSIWWRLPGRRHFSLTLPCPHRGDSTYRLRIFFFPPVYLLPLKTVFLVASPSFPPLHQAQRRRHPPLPSGLGVAGSSSPTLPSFLFFLA